MDYPKIIQGGMGAAISDWKLARAVAKLGQMGVVSGTGIGIFLANRLASGDESSRNALRHFPDRHTVEEIETRYWKPRSENPDHVPSFALPPMWTLNASPARTRLTVAGAFVEVTLAKEGHPGLVGFNILEKAALPNLAAIYGAMLADVDVLLMGAGVPIRIPAVLDALSEHQAVDYPVEVEGATNDDHFETHLNPAHLFDEGLLRLPCKRPAFFPIVSSHVLAQALVKRSGGSIEGFVVEYPVAGGHNAPPRKKNVHNEAGEPVYGPRDKVDLEKIKALGKPFWLAGGFGSAAGLERALDLGAQGIQVGTAYAYCEESGMDPDLRKQVRQMARDGKIQIRTDPLASPTGFPFKVVQIEGSASDADVRKERGRICDLGILRQLYKRPDGSAGYRCPAEPVGVYLKKGGVVEKTANRACLCNGLMATAGLPQRRKDGSVEPALLTSGDDLVNITQFMPERSNAYTAEDVTRQLLAAQR
jgi:nitronate monooxygenase